MGATLSVLLRLFNSRRPVRICMLGLDGAGKTTILYKLKLGDLVTTIPTIGFNVETIEYANISFTIWDVGGQTKIRALWRYYFQNTQALVYVVDSADTSRMEEAREELHAILADPDMGDCKILVYANKQDLPNASLPGDLIDELNLKALRGREWYVQSSNAKTGDGLMEGLEWLQKALN